MFCAGSLFQNSTAFSRPNSWVAIRAAGVHLHSEYKITQAQTARQTDSWLQKRDTASKHIEQSLDRVGLI
jgi:hypothetical protein